VLGGFEIGLSTSSDLRGNGDDLNRPAGQQRS
jgi:hypothetical protein